MVMPEYLQRTRMKTGNYDLSAKLEYKTPTYSQTINLEKILTVQRGVS